MKKENPKTALSTTKTMKVANLDSDSGSSSGTESVADDYSDDSFATSEKSEDTIQAKLDRRVRRNHFMLLKTFFNFFCTFDNADKPKIFEIFAFGAIG